MATNDSVGWMKEAGRRRANYWPIRHKSQLFFSINSLLIYIYIYLIYFLRDYLIYCLLEPQPFPFSKTPKFVIPEIRTGTGAKIINTQREGPVRISRATLGGTLKLGGGTHNSLASGKVFVVLLRSRSSLVAYTRRQAGDWLRAINA